MNKLCCVVNTYRTCNGCRTKWCKECIRKCAWSSSGSYDHKAVDGSWDSGWHCPVAGTVFAERVPLGEPFDFVTIQL